MPKGNEDLEAKIDDWSDINLDDANLIPTSDDATDYENGVSKIKVEDSDEHNPATVVEGVKTVEEELEEEGINADIEYNEETPEDPLDVTIKAVESQKIEEITEIVINKIEKIGLHVIDYSEEVPEETVDNGDSNKVYYADDYEENEEKNKKNGKGDSGTYTDDYDQDVAA